MGVSHETIYLSLFVQSRLAGDLESLRQAEAFLAGLGPQPAHARLEGLEGFLGDLLRRWVPETVATCYRRLRVHYRWLEEEEESRQPPWRE
jgi:hypothetical protein